MVVVCCGGSCVYVMCKLWLLDEISWCKVLSALVVGGGDEL